MAKLSYIVLKISTIRSFAWKLKEERGKRCSVTFPYESLSGGACCKYEGKRWSPNNVMKWHLKWKEEKRRRWKKVKLLQGLKKEGTKHLHSQLLEGFLSVLHNDIKGLTIGVQNHKDLYLKQERETNRLLEEKSLKNINWLYKYLFCYQNNKNCYYYFYSCKYLICKYLFWKIDTDFEKVKM